MDYLAMLGLPIVPVSKFPAGAPVIMLGSQAAGEPDLVAAMKRELAHGSTLILTPALLRRIDPEAAALAGVTVSPQVQLGVGDCGMEVDLGLAATTAEKRVSIPAQGRQVPVLTLRKAGGGTIIVLNVRTFLKNDPGGLAQGMTDTGWLMPPYRLGLPEIDQPLIDALRRDLLAPLKTSLAAPTKVAYYMLGDAKVLYNFRPRTVGSEAGRQCYPVAGQWDGLALSPLIPFAEHLAELLLDLLGRQADLRQVNVRFHGFFFALRRRPAGVLQFLLEGLEPARHLETGAGRPLRETGDFGLQLLERRRFRATTEFVNGRTNQRAQSIDLQRADEPLAEALGDAGQPHAVASCTAARNG